MKEITKMRTSKAVVLNTRPGATKVAPFCLFSICPLEYRDGWLAAQHTPPLSPLSCVQ